MKRKRWMIGVVLVVLLVGIGGAYVLLPKDRITKASWKQIQLGMTKPQVEDILGGPGVDRAEIVFEKDGFLGFCEPLGEKDGEGTTKLVWMSRGGEIEVLFDESDHVRGKWFLKLRRADSNFLRSLRDWLGW